MSATLILLGTVLQILGVASLGVGIRNVRRDFNFGPGLVGAVVQKGRRFNRWVDVARKHLFKSNSQPESDTVEGAGALHMGGLAVAVHIPAPFPPDDQALQIAWLKSRIDTLQESTKVVEQRVKALDNGTESDRAENKSAHTQIVDNFNERIRTFATGGLRLQTWGVALLLVGLVLSCIGALTYGPAIGTPGTGTVIGTFQVVGGPPPGQARAINGSVRFTSTDKDLGQSTIQVNASGHFDTHLAPGEWRVKASSPRVNIGGNSWPCGAPPITLRIGKTIHISVRCDIP